MRNAVELQQLQPSAVYLHDCWYNVGSSAALDGEEYLLRRPMDHHVVDDDVVVSGAQERGELQIESLNEGHPLEIVKVAEFHAGLRRQVLVPQYEGMDGGASDVADEEDIAWPEGHRAGRSHGAC